MVILLVRHGETDNNLLGRGAVVGNDAPLNARGELQAAQAAKICQKYPVEKIYSSPFLRCTRTADCIARAVDAPVVVEKRLKEFDMGEWANLTSDKTKELLQQNNAWDYSDEKYDFRVPGGESWHDVAGRCKAVLSEVTQHDKAVVLVSHNATIRAFLGIMRGADFKDWFGFFIPNAGVSIFEWDGKMYRERNANFGDVLNTTN